MTTLYHFHANLIAAPPADSFAATWEDAAAMLERMPRMIFEPDGSFVVSGSVERAGRAGPSSAPANRWQVDGHLFDFAGRLHRVEIRGHCPPEAFDELLKCLGWPQQSLSFEMVREGERLDEADFRRRAMQPAGQS